MSNRRLTAATRPVQSFRKKSGKLALKKIETNKFKQTFLYIKSHLFIDGSIAKTRSFLTSTLMSPIDCFNRSCKDDTLMRLNMPRKSSSKEALHLAPRSADASKVNQRRLRNVLHSRTEILLRIFYFFH